MRIYNYWNSLLNATFLAFPLFGFMMPWIKKVDIGLVWCATGPVYCGRGALYKRYSTI